MPGITRFFELDAYGRQTGRQLLLKLGNAMPAALEGGSWSGDITFSAANELLASSGFKQVLEAVLENGFEIVERKPSK